VTRTDIPDSQPAKKPCQANYLITAFAALLHNIDRLSDSQMPFPPTTRPLKKEKGKKMVESYST